MNKPSCLDNPGLRLRFGMWAVGKLCKHIPHLSCAIQTLIVNDMVTDLFASLARNGTQQPAEPDKTKAN